MKILIKNALIYGENENITGDILVEGDTIAAVGKVSPDITADRIIDGHGKMAVPGMVNAHTHSYMSVFRNIADDLSFNDWLFGSILPKEDMLVDEDFYNGAALSCIEMIRSGTTCFADMHMGVIGTAQAASDLGVRAIMSRCVVGSDRNDEGAVRRYNEHVREYEQFSGDPLITFVIAPHAIYTCGDDLLRFLMEKAQETGQGFHIHLSESRKEVADCIAQHGCTPVKHLADMGFFDIPTAAAHCVHVTDEDIDIMAQKGVSVLHNPRSNLKLANGIAPVARMLAKGVNVAIGTDSQASNNNLNMYTEMSFAALLQKGVTEEPTVCSAGEVVKMATVNGAKAFGLDNLGKIEPGYKADIVLIDLDKPQFTPRNNIRAALVYSAHGTEADTVLINGEVVMDHGVITRADEERIRFNAEKSAEKYN